MFPDTPDYAGFRDLIFPAKLTAVTLTGGVYHYSWEEQSYDDAGNFTNAIQPRTGNATFSTALEINNQSVGVPTYAWLRLNTSLGGNLRYEFAAAGAGASSLFPVRIVYREWVTATAVVAAGGAGYAVNDTITLAADRVNLILTVTSIGGGGTVTGTVITQVGVHNFGNSPSNPQAQLSSSGGGLGATFTVNLVAQPGGFSPTTFYSWVEQTENTNGFLVDLGGGRSGTTPTNPAIQLNNQTLRAGTRAWTRLGDPPVSRTYDGGAVLGPFYEIEDWLLTVSDEHGSSDTVTTSLGIVGDGVNISTLLIGPSGDPGAVSVQVKGTASPSFTNINVSSSVFFGSSSTVNFNNSTIINFPGSTSFTFHGARFPSAQTKVFTAGNNGNCTFSLTGGSDYGAGGYDGDNTLIAGGTACTIAVSGHYHFTASSLWNATGTLCVIQRIKTSAAGGDVISKGVLRTTLGGTPDTDSGATLECSGDYNCAVGDTITVQVVNNDSVISETLSDAMLHFHRVQ